MKIVDIFNNTTKNLWILREKLEELKYIKLVPTDDIGKLCVFGKRHDNIWRRTI